MGLADIQFYVPRAESFNFFTQRLTEKVVTNTEEQEARDVKRRERAIQLIKKMIMLYDGRKFALLNGAQILEMGVM